MAKTQRRKLPLSGDRLVDILFLVLLDTLEKQITAIHVKEILRDPDNHKKTIFGILTQNQNEDLIFIGKEKHRRHNEPIVQTLIHELLHHTLPGITHRRIYQLEARIWPRLTDSQKRFLRKYVPKHTVKKEP